MVKNKIKKQFGFTELGKLSFFLGVKITDHGSYLSLSQSAYTWKIIESNGMHTAKPTLSTLPMGHVLYGKRTKLTTKEQIQMFDVPYRDVLCSLFYLVTRTRPDIATAVSILGKFATNPATRHLNAMKYLIRYLVKTINNGIIIPQNCKN